MPVYADLVPHIQLETLIKSKPPLSDKIRLSLSDIKQSQ